HGRAAGGRGRDGHRRRRARGRLAPVPQRLRVRRRARARRADALRGALVARRGRHARGRRQPAPGPARQPRRRRGRDDLPRRRGRAPDRRPRPPRARELAAGARGGDLAEGQRRAGHGGGHAPAPHADLVHGSCRRGHRVATWLKASCSPATVEVAPQLRTLSDESLAGFDPVYKVAPPLRTADDVAALRAALAGGAVDSIGTDHAPHTLAEKQQDMLSAPFGIANLEVAFPLLYTRLVAAGELPLERLLWLLQDGPARVMGWPAPRLDPGAPADVTVLDLETERAVEGARFRSKAKHTPWEGEPLKG